MKLATYQRKGGQSRLGVVVGGESALLDAADLAQAAGKSPHPYGSMLALIEAGPEALAALRGWVARPATRATPLADVRLLAPLPRPARLRCFSAYEKHLLQGFEQVFSRRLGKPAFRLLKALGVLKLPARFYEAPAYYKGNHLAVSGPDEVIRWPTYSDQLDYELELAVVMAGGGPDIPREQALNHVFGYTIFNDFSARDALMQELGRGASPGPAKGKDFDTANALGPWIVTADEMGDPRDARMTVSVNGEVRGSALAGSSYHGIDAMIAYASRGETIHPGEVFACGAVGDGTGLEQWRFLQPGDRVELVIERIGMLANTVGPRPPAVLPI